MIKRRSEELLLEVLSCLSKYFILSVIFRSDFMLRLPAILRGKHFVIKEIVGQEDLTDERVQLTVLFRFE